MLTTNNMDYSGFSDADKNWIDTNAVAVHIVEPVWEKDTHPTSSGATSTTGHPPSPARPATVPPPSPTRSAASSTGGRVWTSRRRPVEGPGPSPEHKRGR